MTVLNFSQAAIEAVEPPAVIYLKSHGAKWDGTTDDSAALQTAITESAARGGIPILLPEGEGVINSEPVIPKNLTCIIPIHGAGKFNTIVKLTSAMRFLTYAATEPGDTLGHVEVTDLSINGNNQLTVIEHGSSVIVGQKITSATQVNVKHVYIRDIRTFNVPGLAKKEGGRRNLEIYSYHATPGLPLNVIEHIDVKRLECEGGQSGVNVLGQAPSTPRPINVRLRHILIEDIEHNLPSPATETGYNAHVQVGQNGWTDKPATIIVQRISGSNSADVGFEADVCCIFRDMEFTNENNNAYLLNIFNPSFTGEPVVAQTSALAKVGDTKVKVPSTTFTVGQQLIFYGAGVNTCEVRTIKAKPSASEVELTEALGFEWAAETWVHQPDDIHSQRWIGDNIRGVRTVTMSGNNRILAIQNSENVLPCPAVKIDGYDCQITASDVVNGEILNIQTGTANSPTGNPIAVNIAMKVDRRNVEYSGGETHEYYPISLIARGPVVPVTLKVDGWRMEGPGNTGAGKLAGRIIRASSSAVIVDIDQLVSWSMGSTGGERWTGASLNESSNGDISGRIRQRVRTSSITSGGGAQVGIRVGKAAGFASRSVATKLIKAATAGSTVLEVESTEEFTVGKFVVVDALVSAKSEVFTIAGINEGAKTITLVQSGATPGVIVEHAIGATIALLQTLVVEDCNWTGLGSAGSGIGFEDTTVAVGLRTRGNALPAPAAEPPKITLPVSGKAVQIVQNGQSGLVTLTGGNLTKVEYSPNGTNFYQVAGATNCSVKVNTGDYLKVTYTEEPTVRFSADRS